MSGSKGRMMCDKITSSHMCPSFYDFYLGLAERDHDFPLIEVRWQTSFPFISLTPSMDPIPHSNIT